jgi:uncharacterized membrane protein YeaQ/YmgE (transglycosylase-associated protein family)
VIVGARRRRGKHGALSAFLAGIVGLVVGDVVVSMLHLDENVAVYVGLGVAIAVVAVLTVWLYPAAPRSARGSRRAGTSP